MGRHVLCAGRFTRGSAKSTGTGYEQNPATRPGIHIERVRAGISLNIAARSLCSFHETTSAVMGCRIVMAARSTAVTKAAASDAASTCKVIPTVPAAGFVVTVPSKLARPYSHESMSALVNPGCL